MSTEILALAATAFVVGGVHTILGPDHYLPFLALGRARAWTLRRTVGVALACGAVHVASSVLLGMTGYLGGRAVADMVSLDDARGSLAGWLLLGIGIAYTAWGLRQAVTRKRHSHLHVHGDGTVHSHPHDHRGAHAHPHFDEKGRAKPVAWGLFLVFVFGPCEPLIPLFIFPAASGGSVVELVAVIAAFSLATLGAMAGLVAAGFYAAEGLARRLPRGLERWSHALAGATLAACGLVIGAAW